MKYIIFFCLLIHVQFLQADQSYQHVSKKLEHLFDQMEKGIFTGSELLLSIDERDIDILMKPSVVPTEGSAFAEKAEVACTGAVQGVLCFDVNKLKQFKQKYGSVIWVTDHIRNDDLCHFKDIAGIFAFKEDPSSHAVIVTRVLNIPCLTLPKGISLEESTILSTSGCLKEGDQATLDAFNGKLFADFLPLFHPETFSLFNKIMDMTEKYAKLEVHANADTPLEAKQAIAFGARGIGVTRTEHMFFHPDRLRLFRKIILSKGECLELLQELEDLQKEDFIQLYHVMKSYPVKIRLLDPPLHEFLPTTPSSLMELAKELQIPLSQIQKIVEELHETNPMMGFRGIRLLLKNPQILKMQARAIFEAVTNPALKELKIEPYINLPMVISENEVIMAKKWIDEVAREVEEKTGQKIVYHLGVMMETPRACLLAQSIAPHVDFISFGSNDLTGQTLALSRGDVYEKFLKFYIDTKLLPSDPFCILDPAVCKLMEICIDQVRRKKDHVSIGLCGEQGGEKEGVFICHQMGLNTVSCSPSKIPSVKLFAAQAAIQDQ